MSEYLPTDLADDLLSITLNLFMQLALVVAAAFLISRFLMRRRPAARDALWRYVLVILLLCPATAVVFDVIGLKTIEIALTSAAESSRAVAESPARAVPVNSAVTVKGGRSESSGTEPELVEVGRSGERFGNADKWNRGEGPPRFPEAHSFRSETNRDQSYVVAELATESTQLDGASGIVARADWLRISVTLFFGMWIIGLVILLVRFVNGIRLIQSIRRSARPLEVDGRQAAILDQVRQSLRMESLPPMLTSTRVFSPVTVGCRRPVLLLPADLAQTLDDTQFRNMLIHECAHVKRRDHLVALVFGLVRMVCWPHPLIHLMNRELVRAREEVCDNYVISAVEPTSYARTLLEMALVFRQQPSLQGTIGIFSPNQKLEQRVADLLDSGRSRVTRPNRCLAGLLAVCLFLAAVAAGGARLVATAPQKTDSDPATASRSSDQPIPVVERRSKVDRFGDPLPAQAFARMGTLRLHHGHNIYDLAISPDGTMLASASRDGSAGLWSLKTGREIRRFETGAEVYSVAFSPNGKFLAAGDNNSTITLWNTDSGEEVRKLKSAVRNVRVNMLAFSADGTKLFSGDSSAKVVTWNVATGKLITQVLGLGSNAIALSADAKHIATAGRGKSCLLFDAGTGKVLHVLKGHEGQIRALDFSRDGTILATGGVGMPEVRLWNVATGKEIRRLKGKWGVLSVKFAPDGKTLLTGGQDGLVRQWDFNSGMIVRKYGNLSGWVMSLALTRDGKTFAACEGPNITVWDTATGKEKFPSRGHRKMIWSVALSPDQKTMATADYESIRFWETATGKELRQCRNHPGRGDRIEFSPDGKTLLSNCWDSKLRLWDVATGTELRRFEGHTGVIFGIALSSDGKLAASGGSDGSIRLWDVGSGKEIRQFLETERVKCLAFSPDGKTLAMGSWEKQIHLWDVTSGKLLRTFKQQKATVFSLAFSPDGKTLASSSARNAFIVARGEDDLIRLWDVATGKQVREFGGHPNGYFQVSFSADGRSLVSAGADHRVRLWEVATGKQRGVFTGHRGPVGSAGISRDGRAIVSSGADTTALTWDAGARIHQGKLQRARFSDKELGKAWSDLAGNDAVQASRAMWALVAAGDQSVKTFKKRLHPVAKPDENAIAQRIRDLDNAKFAIRDKAMRELVRLADAAEPHLRKVLAGKPSPEVARRIGVLLKKLHSSIPAGDRIRELRAVEVLEQIGTPSAIKALATLANGQRGARLTRESKASLKRLAD